jgi:hypothetical protein
MRPKFARFRSKLGLRVALGSIISVVNGAVPAIPDAHSILMELFFNFNGLGVSLGSNPCIVLYNAAYNESMHYYCNNTARQSTLRLGSVAGGADLATTIPYPAIPKDCYYLALLLDRTNNRKKVYSCGDLARNDAIAAVNPTFNTINNLIYLACPGGITVVDFTYMVFRLSTFSSVPADMNAAVKRMWYKPMTLDPSLQTVKVLASQYDFEDVSYANAAHTIIADHGLIGGYPLTSPDLRALYRIAESC